MLKMHGQKILFGAVALGLILAVASSNGRVTPAAPLSPLWISPLWISPASPLPTPLGAASYLPEVTRDVDAISPLPTPAPVPTSSLGSTAYLPFVPMGFEPARRLRRETPTPTPLPTPDWPSALSQPGSSKLGLHVIQNNTPHIMEFVRRAQPAVVKGLGGFGWATEVKRVSPETVTVARLLEDHDEGVMTGDPEERARNFVARHVAEYLLNPGVDYWEGWNEPVPGENMAWYARFEAERARRMADHGLRVAVGGFATGMPEWDQFVEFLPAIEAALAHDGILTLHEYAAPTLDYRMGEALPGHPAYPDRGVLLLRYRWWYEDFLKPRGLVIPLVISEGGIDGQVRQDLAPPGLGWRDFTAYWRQEGLGRDGAQAYVQQLAWYDQELQQDDYVIGVAIFTAGSPAGHWPSFDITAILPELAKYVVSQR